MQPSSRPLRDASAPDEAPTAVHPTEVRLPVTEPEPLAPTLAAGDQCANCGSALASDQHYCLVCGERRGAARFSALPATGAVTTTTITDERVRARPPRFSSATTLIAGVATLLIAMGIGVYIGGLGKNNNSAPARQTIVTVGGGAAAAPAASTPTSRAAAGSGATSAKKGKKGGSHKNAAAKVVTTVKNAPPPTVTVGASGSGRGFQKGKFTGHFFGP